MERIKKVFLFLFSIGLMLFVPVFAEDLTDGTTQSQSLSTLVTPQNVSFEMCTRTFQMNSDRLFYLTLAAVNANRFEIKEIQSKTGYILFTAVGKEFLASVISIDKYRSMLKITPANNNYYFAPGIVLNMYKYIEVNMNVYLQNIPKNI